MSKSDFQFLRNPAFLIIGAILLTAAVSLNAATQMLKLYFRKEPVELRRPLVQLPERIGPWFQLTRDEPMGHAEEEALGTKIHISRQYVDLRVVGEDIVKTVRDKSNKELLILAAQIQQQYPNDFPLIQLHSTYYTGMVDTVAHIPNRCYIASGLVAAKENYQEWPAVTARMDVPPTGGFRCPFVTFEDPTGRLDNMARNVTYMFHANGRYLPDSETTRLALQDLTSRFCYYSKIELMLASKDREGSARKINEFLTYLLPEAERCLPDWKEVLARPNK